MKQVNFGIDLGTTNSLIAKYEDGKVVVYRNPVGFSEALPSVVAYRPDRMLVGEKAREYINKDSINVFSSFKRKMGTDEKYYVVNLDENVTPIELSTIVLNELKQFVTEPIKPQASVITIPASFDTMQSNATLKAGLAAGFKDVFLLQEPIAASLAYFNTNASGSQGRNGYWLVYDFGGGTFDAALVKVADDEMKIVENAGNNFLGGVDFDYLIVSQIIVPFMEKKLGLENFEEQLTEKFGTYEKLYYLLLYLAENAKKELSINSQTEIEFSASINGENHEFIIPITQEQLNQLFLPKVNETIACIHKILTEVELETTDIQEIILVGGSTYLPIVRNELSRQTGIKVNTSIDPTTAIAVGAAYYASTKYYQSEVEVGHEADAILNSIFENDDATENIDIQLSYSPSSRDVEELVLISTTGNCEGFHYRITRSDGGFDTGLIPLKAKKSEFVFLIADTTNMFTLRIFDAQQQELTKLEQKIQIVQGKYSIDGQPVPNDICIEVDDVENKITKLEVIFERNSLLPLKRTLYRTFSKTLKKGSSDTVVISIVEGDRNARPSSNLPIGCIVINGKDIDFDVVKGSDIEIELQMSESRILTSKVYLVMTKQEFKNVFSVSERTIHLPLLREQAQQLEEDLRFNLFEYQHREEKLLEIQVDQLLHEIKEAQDELSRLSDKDNSDKKYIIADKLWKASQAADKIGGKERITELIERYLDFKVYVQELISSLQMNKEKIQEQFNRVVRNEASFLKSKNASVIENGIKQMDYVCDIAHSSSVPFLIGLYTEYSELDDSEFSSANAARSLLKQADRAIQKEDYPELRRTIVGVYGLMLKPKVEWRGQNFTGTGIG